jgi:hypothetical protein
MINFKLKELHQKATEDKQRVNTQLFMGSELHCSFMYTYLVFEMFSIYVVIIATTNIYIVMSFF